MPDIHGETLVREEEFDVPCVFVCFTHALQFDEELSFLVPRQPPFGFHAEQRFFHAPRPKTDQGCAGHERMLIENTLAIDGEKIAVLRLHAMGFPTAEPEATLLIEITQITHAFQIDEQLRFFVPRQATFGFHAEQRFLHASRP